MMKLPAKLIGIFWRTSRDRKNYACIPPIATHSPTRVRCYAKITATFPLQDTSFRKTPVLVQHWSYWGQPGETWGRRHHQQQRTRLVGTPTTHLAMPQQPQSEVEELVRNSEVEELVTIVQQLQTRLEAALCSIEHSTCVIRNLSNENKRLSSKFAMLKMRSEKASTRIAWIERRMRNDKL